MSKQRRTTRTKFVFRLRQTNARQHKISTKETKISAKCPLCGIRDETTRHVIRCKSVVATKFQTKAMHKFQESLNQAQNHPDIITLLWYALNESKEGDDRWPIISHDPKIMALYEQQR